MGRAARAGTRRGRLFLNTGWGRRRQNAGTPPPLGCHLGPLGLKWGEVRGVYELDKGKFGRFVAGRRHELGLTQRELASRLGVSDKAVSKWETGVSRS